MGIKETVIEFAEKVGDTVDKGIRTGSEEIQKMTEKSKLQKEISQNNTEINNIFLAVGQKLFNDDPDNETFAGVFSAVKEKQARIEELKKQLAVLEDKITCTACGELMSKNADVCPKCGAANESKKSAETAKKEDPIDKAVDAEEVKTCPKCGKALDADAKFCDQCGAKYE